MIILRILQTLFAVQVVTLILLIFVKLITHFIFPLVVVTGDSMEPTYHNGECLFTLGRMFIWRLKPGDIVCYRPPNDKSRKVIKRISQINGNLIYCLGDNAKVSYDSRAYGWIERKSVTAKIIFPRKKR